jgi:hypothetical protein
VDDVKRYCNMKSAIKLDPFYDIYGKFGDTGYSPAKAIDDGVENWHNKFDVYINPKPQTTVDWSEYNFIFNKVVSRLSNSIEFTEVYDTTYVIDGVPGVYDSMPKGTSASYPFTLLFPTKGDALLDSRVRHLIDLQWEHWLDDDIALMPYTTHIKDELLPDEKTHKPRPFYSVDVVTNVNCARLTRDFNVKLCAGRHDHPIAAGHSPFARQMDKIWKKHSLYKYHYAGDVSQFDSSLRIWIAVMIMNIRIYFMMKNPYLSTREKQNIVSRMRAMYTALAFGNIIDPNGTIRNKFFQFVTGYISTYEDNSLTRWILEEMIYHKMGYDFNGVADYGGDDSLVSHNLDIDMELYFNTAASLGYKITSDKKDGPPEQLPLIELTFCKAGFLKTSSGYIYQYEPNRIKSILKYIKSTDGTIDQRVNAALLLSYGQEVHGEIRTYARWLVSQGALTYDLIMDDRRLRQIIFAEEASISITQQKIITTHTQCLQYQSITNKMAEATNNSADFDMFSSLQTDNEVQTTAKKVNPQTACVQKLIHPPSAVPSFDGIPTNDARSQVLVQWRNAKIMDTPYIFDYTTSKVAAVTGGDLNTFDYAILTTNGARVLSVGFVYNHTKNAMTQDLNNVDIQDSYGFTTHWQDDANLYRPVYRSLTTYLNATAFNDTGLVAGNQFNPSILFAGTLLELAHTKANYFYQFVSDGFRQGRYPIVRPEHADFDDVNTSYTAIPGYMRTEISRVLGLRQSDALKLDPDTTIQVLNIGQVGPPTSTYPTAVPTVSQIMNNSMRSYAGKAKEGTFTVSRLNTIAPRWLSASNTRNGKGGLYECYTYTKSSDGGSHFVPIAENSAVGTTELTNLLDTLWTEDMTFSWTYYSGLSLNPQSNVSYQMLIKKYYTGYEVQPTPRSAWSGMVKLAPKPDLLTLEALMDAFYELKECVPARYNFWGALGSMAASGLKTFGSSVLENLMKPKDKEIKNESSNKKEDDEISKLRRQIKDLQMKEGRPKKQRKPFIGPRNAPAHMRTPREGNPPNTTQGQNAQPAKKRKRRNRKPRPPQQQQ